MISDLKYSLNIIYCVSWVKHQKPPNNNQRCHETGRRQAVSQSSASVKTFPSV